MIPGGAILGSWGQPSIESGLVIDQWNLLSRDGWDNLLADHVPTGGAGLLAYSPTGNRLTQTDPVTGDVTTFTYDNGNQLTIEEPSDDITTNTWDGENRLIQV